MALLASIGNFKLFGLHLRGWAWFLMLALSVFYLIPRKKLAVRFPWLPWLPWFLWVAYKTDFTNSIALQRLAILLTPILVACAVSTLNRVSINILKNSYLLLGVCSLCIYGCAVLQSGMLIANTYWYAAEGAAMTFCLIMIATIANIDSESKRGYTFLVLYFMVLIFIQSRMPILVILAAMVFGLRKISLRSRVALGFLLFSVGIILFMSVPIQENLFRSGHGTITDVISCDPALLKVGGRLTAWPLYINNIEDIWFGDGSTESVVFGNATFGARKWAHPHNEYIRVLFDYGIVGVFLLSIPIVWLLVLLYRKSRSYNAPDDRWWLYSVSINGIFAVLLLGISGNVLMYVAYIGNMLFATIGCIFATEGKIINAEGPDCESLPDSQ